VDGRAPNIGIVTALQRHPFRASALRDVSVGDPGRGAKRGAVAQVAGGVPAMCERRDAGLPGMELSLFSRDVIAMERPVALAHDVFDAALLLGVCDKIVPGLLIGALHFGHLPCVFVPAGPMSTGLGNAESQRCASGSRRGRWGATAARSRVGRVPQPGTCTFYGTANGNQVLLEAMGLHVPARRSSTRTTGLRERSRASRCAPCWRSPGAAALHADRQTGGRARDRQRDGRAARHRRLHQPPDPLVAVARAAGIRIDWTDFSDLSHATPLLARVYPNGKADVNQFQAAGGPGFVIAS